MIEIIKIKFFKISLLINMQKYENYKILLRVRKEDRKIDKFYW